MPEPKLHWGMQSAVQRLPVNPIFQQDLEKLIKILQVHNGTESIKEFE